MLFAIKIVKCCIYTQPESKGFYIHVTLHFVFLHAFRFSSCTARNSPDKGRKYV